MSSGIKARIKNQDAEIVNCTARTQQTLRLKHGRVVVDVLNEHRHRQIRRGAVPTVTRQTEPKQIVVITIFYCMRE